MAKTKTTFIPLDLEGINEGLFLSRINESLRDLQEGLEHFRKTHEASAEGAKATLDIKVELVVLDPSDGGYGIKATYKTGLPRHPAMTSLAMAGESQDGRPALIVRNTGSDRDDPRQKKMFGRSVKDDENDDEG